jgi:hypothetical protein
VYVGRCHDAQVTPLLACATADAVNGDGDETIPASGPRVLEPCVGVDEPLHLWLVQVRIHVVLGARVSQVHAVGSDGLDLLVVAGPGVEVVDVDVAELVVGRVLGPRAERRVVVDALAALGDEVVPRVRQERVLPQVLVQRALLRRELQDRVPNLHHHQQQQSAAHDHSSMTICYC